MGAPQLAVAYRGRVPGPGTRGPVPAAGYRGAGTGGRAGGGYRGRGMWGPVRGPRHGNAAAPFVPWPGAARSTVGSPPEPARPARGACCTRDWLETKLTSPSQAPMGGL